MDGRPSEGMRLDELRDEFDWMFEFQSRMAERIRGDADVHNLADYVSKLEAENAKLRELVNDLLHDAMENVCSKSYWCHEKDWQACNDDSCGSHLYVDMARELGIEVDA